MKDNEYLRSLHAAEGETPPPDVEETEADDADDSDDEDADDEDEDGDDEG